jgi:hypothetical protein
MYIRKQLNLVDWAALQTLMWLYSKLVSNTYLQHFSSSRWLDVNHSQVASKIAKPLNMKSILVNAMHLPFEIQNGFCTPPWTTFLLFLNRDPLLGTNLQIRKGPNYFPQMSLSLIMHELANHNDGIRNGLHSVGERWFFPTGIGPSLHVGSHYSQWVLQTFLDPIYISLQKSQEHAFFGRWRCLVFGRNL